MPRGRWSAITQIGLIALSICAILAVAGYAIYEANLARVAYRYEATEASNRNSHRSREQMYRNCIEGTPAEKHDCIEQVRDTDRDYRRQERDLEAQLTTATWTAFMGAAALIGMALSLIGVILVFVTFRATKRGADTAQNTYKAFIALERPRIVVNVARIARSPAINVRPATEMEVKNIGKSSCVVTGIHWFWQDTPTHDKAGIFMGPPRSVLVAPSTSETLGGIKFTSPFKPFLCGVVNYTSPLGEHASFFCFKIDPEQAPHYVSCKGKDWPEDT